jgi:hypothetical protein
MPSSNKRTASLPRAHSICLWSHCFALPGSPPLGLCQVTALCQIHAPPGSRPLGLCWASAPQRIQAPLGYMFQGLCQIPASHRIHAPPGSPPLRLCLALVQHQIHERPGSLPLGHTRPQPPAGSTTRQDPHPLGHAGPQSHNGFRPPTPIPAPKAALGPSPVPDPCSSWIPTSWAMLDPHTTTAMPDNSHALDPHSAKITATQNPASQALLGPISMWDDQSHTSLEPLGMSSSSA